MPCGVTYGDELIYLFKPKVHHKVEDENVFLRTVRDHKVSNQMIQLWVNFAKYNNPTPNPTKTTPLLKEFTWDAYQSNLAGPILHIGKYLIMSLKL